MNPYAAREMFGGMFDAGAHYDAVSITLASPETIRSWSHGEVRNPETINYRTYRPERDGLFCERIFGPTRDWECACGKYKRIKHKGVVCDRCGVEVTVSRVRRQRMGHIELAVPVSHIWFFKCTPSRIGLVLDKTAAELERVLYYEDYMVIDPGETPLKYMQLLTEPEYLEAVEKYGENFEAMMGAEAVRRCLTKVDLEQLMQDLEEQIENTRSKQTRKKITKRMKIADGFRVSGARPEWMILDCLPVIPPELRPLVPLEGGRFATSDLNDLYRRVINRNNRLRNLLSLKTPDVIIRNEKRMLQEAVDAVFDNGRHGRAVAGAGNRPLKSLSDMLKGKTGRFRQNLLGKRVDYSGRSVIVVGPELKITQCGLPKKMALTLFEPFIIRRLKEKGICHTVRTARKMIERHDEQVWDILEEVTKGKTVMLNRAPTLHRLSIQSFEPVLIEGEAIRIHPMVCTAFNADFDGDQMAVHVPLSAEAQAEARLLMLSANNLLKPQDGAPVTVPSQDMVLGAYYLTMTRDELGTGKVFKDSDEALLAYAEGIVGIHSPIRVRRTRTVGGITETRIIDATVGRLIFNQSIPQDLDFVDRSDPDKAFDLEITFVCGKKELQKIITRAINKHGFTETAELLDRIKALGYKYSTIGAITVSAADMSIPKAKYELVAETEKRVGEITDQYKMGFITNDERYRLVIEEWEKTTKDVTKALMDNLDPFNPIMMMSTSGARGSVNQIRQLAGMRGLMADTSGRTIDIPIKANFREGLTVLEYFISSRGARKGLADTALRTADSGYLTRRLVDVSQDVIIREEDCGTTEGIDVYEINDGKQVIEPFADRLVGRFASEDIVHPETGEVLVPRNKMMDDRDAKAIIAAGITHARIRTVLHCKARTGVCAKCYGSNLAFKEPIGIGEAVGIIAAQSIGEPGTQLTMKVSVIVPEEYMGDVIGDLNSRRGQIQKLEARAAAQQIDAFVPLSEMFGYATDLRSRTQGRGQYTMEPSHYTELPKSLQEKLIAGK